MVRAFFLSTSPLIFADICTRLDKEKIYRIDHYLGMETVQNLMALRFGNSLFEPLWRRGRIVDVQIKVAEQIGVGLVSQLQPEERITLTILAKTPREGMRLKPVNLNLHFAEAFKQPQVDAYERLLMDVVRGNLTLFTRRVELDAAWRFAPAGISTTCSRGPTLQAPGVRPPRAH